MKHLSLIFLLLLLVVINNAQTANVYFYRVKEVAGIDNRNAKVYLEEKLIFEMKQFSWVGFKLKAGNYGLRMRQKRTETLLKLESDKTYFIRISQTPEGFFFGEKIEIIADSEQATYQMRELRILDKKRIKDKSLEVLPEKPNPAN